MTEQEWLTSEDPAAMLRTVRREHETGQSNVARVSDRKLRLWVEACRQRAGVSDHFDIYNAGLRLAVEYWCGEDGRPLSRADRAALLRDIVGNPFRPVTVSRLEGRPGGDRCRVFVPWLTPTVVSLAQAAYDERVAPCGRCGGSGTLLDIEDFDTDARTEESCGRCHGTGIIDDGTLDPVRLAILADALEEAGCPAEEWSECPDCSRYKDDPDNHWPGKLGYRPVRDVASGRHEGGWGNCYRCNGGGKGHWRPGFVLLPNPLLAHLRRPANCNACDSTGIGMDEYSGTVEVPGHCPRCGGQVGPHYRGCWALSLILGQD